MELHYPQKPNGMFIISKNQMDDIATMTLREYMPWALEYPQMVDIEKLSEEGLFLTIQNKMLGFSNAVLGMTAFEDVEGIPCLDDMFNPITIDLPAGTVLIHSWLIGYENRYRRRFTIAHECSHWMLHRTYHSPSNQKYQFRMQRSPYIACRSVNIERPQHHLETDDDWEEWQADSLAAALLMPLAPFRHLAENLIYGKGYRFFSEGKVTSDRIDIVEEISDRFMVSKTAVEIRLRQLGLIRKEWASAF